MADGAYPALLALFGCICLTMTGGWRFYTDPLRGAPGAAFASSGEAAGRAEGRDAAGQGEERPGGYGAAFEDCRTAETSDGRDSEEDGPEGGLVPPVSEFGTVEDDYFADAVFIGDSRTVGLYEYGELQDVATFYASTGLTVHKLFTEKIVEVPGQKKKITVEEALKERSFAKVYLMIGINEMGTGTAETFLQKYAECVAYIRELQPDALIYLQSILCVTEERSAQGDYITNEGIDVRNRGIEEMADNEGIFYLDVNSAVRDETGGMAAGYTHDGVHLKAQYIALWKDYLKCHAVVR